MSQGRRKEDICSAAKNVEAEYNYNDLRDEGSYTNRENSSQTLIKGTVVESVKVDDGFWVTVGSHEVTGVSCLLDSLVTALSKSLAEKQKYRKYDFRHIYYKSGCSSHHHLFNVVFRKTIESFFKHLYSDSV